MSQLALTLSRFSLPWEDSPECGRGLTREVLFLGIFLALLQVMDGVLTAVGVYRFGLGAEANLFIRCVMESIGVVSALVILKTFAIGIVATLCVLAPRVSWLPRAMWFMAGVYVFAAILPWTAILMTKMA